MKNRKPNTYHRGDKFLTSKGQKVRLCVMQGNFEPMDFKTRLKTIWYLQADGEDRPVVDTLPVLKVGTYTDGFTAGDLSKLLNCRVEKISNYLTFDDETGTPAYQIFKMVKVGSVLKEPSNTNTYKIIKLEPYVFGCVHTGRKLLVQETFKGYEDWAFIPESWLKNYDTVDAVIEDA